MRKIDKLGLVFTILAVLIFIFPAEPVMAQWPPFNFTLTPSYQDGKITYRIEFIKLVKWPMTDVTIKIPLPEGTRYLEATSLPSTGIQFDGVEVTFLTPGYPEEITETYLTVEVADTTRTVFTARAWITWHAEQPGSFWAEEVSIDITKPTLNWTPPPQPRLRLDLKTEISNDIITYYILPANVGKLRMWDVKINVPIPEGTTFLSAEAPPRFSSSYNGQEVSFTTVELDRFVKPEPLKLQVSSAGATTPFVVTHAWASWKNSHRRVIRDIPPQEETRSSDILVQLDDNASRVIFSDPTNDVPLLGHDITNVSFENYASAFKLTFHTAGEIGPIGSAKGFVLFIDSDCKTKTGTLQNKIDRPRMIGADYQIRYRHDKGRTHVDAWREEGEDKGWQEIGQAPLATPANNQMISIMVPYDLIGLQNLSNFCWIAEARDNTTAYTLPLPNEVVVPGWQGLQLSPSQTTPPAVVVISANKPDRGSFIRYNDIWQYMPGWTEPDPQWKEINFDDSNWFSGRPGIGYGNAKKIKTHLGLVTQAVTPNDTAILVQRTITESGVVLATLTSGADDASVFIRRAFTVGNLDRITKLILEIDYEDGLVAYLNGAEVSRRSLAGSLNTPVVYDALASDHPSGIPELIDLSNHISRLVTGTNVLAIQVHRSADPPLNLYVAPRLTWQYNPQGPTTAANTPVEVAVDVPLTTPTTPPSLAEISGKLAVPLDNGRIAYDVHIFALPGGQELAKISNARQPNFRFDGQRLLINREGGGVENLFEYNLVDNTEKQVSDAPRDSHPFYDPQGNRVVYDNPELIRGSGEGARQPFIFVQCSLLTPHLEFEARCRDIPGQAVLVPAGHTGEIQGTQPVWTNDDMIVYTGCNTWAGSKLCGIYIVPSISTRGLSDGFIPRQLTRETSDIPADTKGALITFSSHRDGNWEAYIMDLNGNNVTNLSNNSTSNDGLPTLSPDGKWVAFVSDRSGVWAVWVVSVAGGPAQKLFDLPVEIPWGDGDRSWVNERISWAP